MNISSRTPEGSPGKCFVCGAVINIAPSYPADDAPCPVCGTLVFFEPITPPLGRYARFHESFRVPLYELAFPKTAVSIRAIRVHPAATPIGIFAWMLAGIVALELVLHFFDPVERLSTFAIKWSDLIVPLALAGSSRSLSDYVQLIPRALLSWLQAVVLGTMVLASGAILVAIGAGHFIGWIAAGFGAMVAALMITGLLGIAAQLVDIVTRRHFADSHL